MTDVRIKEKATDRITVPTWQAEVDPEDEVLLGQILTREHRARRLPMAKRDYCIQAWHWRRGWIEHPG